MAKEHGLMEHKGKTIPREVKSLADRIRKDQPDKNDEYAYRTAWDIYRSHTAEGKSYPNKSTESGLAREGGGTGPISKTSSVNFWDGFEKRSATLRNLLARAGAKEPSLNYSTMLSSAEKAIRSKSQSPAALTYRRGVPSYTKPGVIPA